MFQENGSDFKGVAITAIDVHPFRNNYIVLGFDKGYLILIDCSEPKKLKVIKDHHNFMPVQNIRFCDWHGSRSEKEKQADEKKKQNNKNKDKET